MFSATHSSSSPASRLGRRLRSWLMIKASERSRPSLSLIRYSFLRGQLALLIPGADVHFTFYVNRLGRGINRDATKLATVHVVKTDVVRMTVLAAQPVAQQIAQK